jgi:peptidoglycan/LPS O-acetylase OafA/YrhL
MNTETTQLQPAKLAYMKHIDGLRATAVLMVFFFHLNPSFMPGDFIGVDVFLLYRVF